MKQNVKRVHNLLIAIILVLTLVSFIWTFTSSNDNEVQAALPSGVNESTMRDYGLDENSYFWKKALWNRVQSTFAKDVVTRPYPRLGGNQWNVKDDGNEDQGDTNKYQEYAAQYFDLIWLNRVRGAYSDKFLDTYDSVFNPQKGLLKYRNNVYAKNQKYNRRCYVLAYHAVEGIENYSPPTTGYNYWFHNHIHNPWKTSDNKGTWDLVDQNNAWYRYSNGSLVKYTNYDVNKRRIFDQRKDAMRRYWAAHAHHAIENFDGIFADNFLRSIGPDSSGWRKGVNQATQLLRQKIGNDKIIIGNGYYSGDYTARDFGMIEDWSGNWKWDFSESDAFANKNQAATDTSAKAAHGSLWDRLARNLMTDDFFAIHEDENGGVVYFIDTYIRKLGKIGYPVEDRVNLGNNAYKREFTHGIAYWNNSGGTYTFNVPAGKYKDINGNDVSGNISVPNRKGIILKAKAQTMPLPVDPTVLMPPTDLTLIKVTKGATSGDIYADMQWKDNSADETGFKIFHAVDSTKDEDFKLVKSTSAGTTKYNVNIGKQPDGVHYFRIAAVRGEEISVYSNIVSKTIGAPKPPLAPSDLKIKGVTRGTQTGSVFVDLEWKDNSADETGFEVLHSFNSQEDADFKVIKSPPAGTTTYNVNIGKDVEQGNHYFKVVALRNGMKSEASNIVMAKIGPAGPVAPSDLNIKKMSKGSKSGNIYIYLEWKDNSDDERSFEIQQSFDATGNNWRFIKSVKADILEYKVNMGPVPELGTHYFRVLAVNSDGKNASNIVNTAIGATPEAPTDLTFSKVVKGKTTENYYAVINWQDNSDEEVNFEILQSEDGEVFSIVKKVPADKIQTRINLTQAPLDVYYFKVVAVGRDGKSAPSNTVEAKISR